MTTEERMKKLSFRDQLVICSLSGGMAGFITDCVYFPLDTIKTRLQASFKGVDYMKKAKNVSL